MTLMNTVLWIWDVLSRILDPDFYPSLILDPGSKGKKCTGSRILYSESRIPDPSSGSATMTLYIYALGKLACCGMYTTVCTVM
jgi:hypothetical protein